MPVTADIIRALVEVELSRISDDRVVAHIHALLVSPKVVMRDWDYGAKDQQHPCWSVLEQPSSNTGIAYCEHGFGPTFPWGLVFLEGTEHMSMGMDSGWFPSFLAAYFESQVSTELPIWRVFQHTAEDFGVALTPEGDWAATWQEVERLRLAHPSNRYHCGQSLYRSEA